MTTATHPISRLLLQPQPAKAPECTYPECSCAIDWQDSPVPDWMCPPVAREPSHEPLRIEWEDA